MRASVNTVYGPPEVAKVMEVEKPVPGNGEILIRVHATTVNRTDCGFRSAQYFISRFFSGLIRPRNKILGNEFAGEVEETGEAVSQFRIGDRVFGYNDSTFGAHAEYMKLKEGGAITTMPEGLSFEEAAPITEGAHYALGNIRAAKVQAGHNVLVNGATGGIGSAAVQLLKHFGASVTAVCHGSKVDLVRSLGADEVIDYSENDFTRSGGQYDFIFDAVGKSSFKKCRPLLKNKGIYISTELGKHSANIFLALVTPIFRKKKVLFPLPSISKADVIFLKELVEQGKFKPVIDRTYALEEIVEAYRYVEKGEKVGNVVVKV